MTQSAPLELPPNGLEPDNHKKHLAIPLTKQSDDETLDLTRHVRQVLLNVELQNGIPTESRDRRRVMDLLAQIDESTLTRKKLVSDDANADKNREAALLVRTIRDQQGGTRLYDIPNEARVIPSADANQLPQVELMAGEMSTDVSTQTHDEFISKHQDSTSDS